MRSKLTLLLSVGLVFLTACTSSNLEVYVSPNGDDTNAGTLHHPFATLEKARDYIRSIKTDIVNEDITIYLRDGVYTLSETFVLKPDDSAPDGGHIIYSHYKDEKPIISSGVNVNNWTKVDVDIEGLPASAVGKVWVADIPASINGFLTMYDADLRLPRARTNGFVPDTDLHPRNNLILGYDKQTLYYPQGAIRNWSNLSDAELFIIPSYPWWMNILSFESVDEDKRIAKTSLIATDYMSDMVYYCRGGEGYEKTAWIENVPEGLDMPGEWFVNTKTRKIYLWPTTSQPSEDIYVPALRELVLLEGVNDEYGNKDIPVRGISFCGITFTKSDRGVWEDGDQGIQHDWEMLDKDNAMLRFRGAEDCLVEKCHFFNAGGNAIRMDLYAQHISVENCLFNNLGQSAVMMLGYGLGTKDVNKFNRVYNNHIHHCGEIDWQSQMITAWQSGYNYIGHNYLHDIPRKAICISGIRFHWLSEINKNRRECVNSIRWNEIGSPKSFKEMSPFLHARNNIVEYNKIHDALEQLGDGAAINLSGGGDDNIVRFNYIYDIKALNPSGAIRTDNDQNKALIENNIVCNISSSGIAPKGENVYRNNFIINACTKKNYGLIRGIGQHEGGLTDLEHNIVYNTSKEIDFYYFHKYEAYTPTEIQSKTVNSNLYFSPYRTEDEWPSLGFMKSLGYDQKSRFADPLFVDWENGNFTLKAESPALKMGIHQIDIKTVGLTDDFYWKE